MVKTYICYYINLYQSFIKKNIKMDKKRVFRIKKGFEMYFFKLKIEKKQSIFY